MSDPAWLPELVKFEDFEGKWEKYLPELYKIFDEDFIKSKPVFRGTTLALKRHPIIEGKEYTFWHIISEGDIENERTPDFRRCERIKWVRKIIENSEDQVIKFWENNHRGERRFCLWFESHDYLIVLGQRKSYILLVTAYPVTQNHTKRKLEKEYQAYLISNGNNG